MLAWKSEIETSFHLTKLFFPGFHHFLLSNEEGERPSSWSVSVGLVENGFFGRQQFVFFGVSLPFSFPLIRQCRCEKASFYPPPLPPSLTFFLLAGPICSDEMAAVVFPWDLPWENESLTLLALRFCYNFPWKYKRGQRRLNVIFLGKPFQSREIKID